MKVTSTRPKVVVPMAAGLLSVTVTTLEATNNFGSGRIPGNMPMGYAAPPAMFEPEYGWFCKLRPDPVSEIDQSSGGGNWYTFRFGGGPGEPCQSVRLTYLAKKSLSASTWNEIWTVCPGASGAGVKIFHVQVSILICLARSIA